MTRHGITAVMVGMLALAMSVPAWADCNNQVQLCPTTGCTPTSASGVAEAKVVTANALLRIKAVNKVDADVSGLGSELPFKVTVFSGSTEVAHAFFFTDTAGAGDVDIRGLSTTCSIKSVKVTKFAGGAIVLQGTLGPEVEPAEVEVQIENELQVEAQAELNDILPHVSP